MFLLEATVRCRTTFIDIHFTLVNDLISSVDDTSQISSYLTRVKSLGKKQRILQVMKFVNC